MSDVTVIGLGAMGSALARTVLKAGYSVTVWNRSSDKIKPLLNIGASQGATFADAIQASSCVLACVDCYATFNSLLIDENIILNLKGKTFVQFAQGTPTEARSSETWLSNHGAGYLDGTIFCFPSMLGDPESTILIGGNKSCYESVQKYLNPLAGDLRFFRREYRCRGCGRFRCSFG